MFRTNDKMPLIGRVFFILIGMSFALLAYSVIRAGKYEFSEEWEARAVPFSIVESEHPVQFWVQVTFMALFSLISFHLAMRKGENHVKPPIKPAGSTEK
jgi:hypothetical protein